MAIQVEVSGLALNEAITVKDLKLPEGVKVLHHKPDDHVCLLYTSPSPRD